MTREEYADYMRQLPSAEIDEPPEPPSTPVLDLGTLGESAWGMTREEYADYMRQLPAAEGDDPVGRGLPQPGHGTILDEKAQADVLAPAADALGDSRQVASEAADPDAPDGRQEPAAWSGERASGARAGVQPGTTADAQPPPVLTGPDGLVEVETSAAGDQSGDSWDTDPDTENYSHWDQAEAPEHDDAGNEPDDQVSDAGTDEPDTVQDLGSAVGDQAADADTGDQADSAESASPEHQRIQALEAKLAKANQKTAELETKNDLANQKIGELEAEKTEANQRIGELEAKSAEADQRMADLEAKNAELTARMDRFEQLLAGPEKTPDNASVQEHGDISPDQSQDAAIAERAASDHEREATETEPPHWRRVVSSGSFEVASAAAGIAGSVSDFVMHPTPVGAATAGAALFTIGAVGLKRLEQSRKGKG
jgi:uncharacterized coiled-coil protein SlyX